MRRMLMVAGMALGFMVVGAPSCQPAEPAMTITAAVPRPDCMNDQRVEGVVTPKTATTKVVLQRTVGGKWTDFTWYETADSGEARHALTATLKRDGSYRIEVMDQWWNLKLNGTYHMRVRSLGGTAFSPGVYMTFPAVCA